MSFVSENYANRVVGTSSRLMTAKPTTGPLKGNEYHAQVWSNPEWCSVDGDEWYGEFDTLADAEAYLRVTFKLDQPQNNF